jgi:hypothetical protein
VWFYSPKPNSFSIDVQINNFTKKTFKVLKTLKVKKTFKVLKTLKVERSATSLLNSIFLNIYSLRLKLKKAEISMSYNFKWA